MFFLSAHDFVRRSEKVLTFFIISERDRSRGRVIACGGSNSRPSWRWLIQHRTAPTFTGHLRHLEANFNNGEVAISAGIRNKHFVSEKGNKSSPILQSYIRRLWLKYLPFISSLESWICDGIKRDRGEPRSVTLETRNTLLGTLRKNKIPIAPFLNRSVFLTT